MAAFIQGNGKTDLGTTGTPWTNGYFTNLYKGGVAVPVTTDSRFPTADEKAALVGSSGSPSSSNKFVTAADRSRKWVSETIVGLLGGGSTKLDGYVTAGVTVGLIMEFIDDNSGSPIARTYQLVSGTDAESSPSIIRPDDYAGGTNEKVWKLRGSATDADALVVAFNPDEYTETAATVAGHLEGIDDAIAALPTSRTGVYRQLSCKANEFHANTGAPTISAITFGSIIMQAATLVDGASGSILCTFRLPDTWDTSEAPKFKLEWSGSTTMSGNVAFSVQGRLFDAEADLTAALGTAHTFTDAQSTLKYLHLTDGFQPTLAGSGKLCLLNVQRTGADAADTYTGSVYLTGVYCQFKELTTEPSVW